MSGRYRYLYALLGTACALATADAVRAQPHAHFELRLAPGQSDAVMNLVEPAEQTLDLEVWVSVTGIAGDVRATAYSLFLDDDTNGIIAFDDSYVSPPFTFGCVSAGTDDMPDGGDFGRACVEPGGTTVGMGTAGLWAQFSIAAVNLGVAHYAFHDNGGARVWRVSLSNGSTLQGSALSYSLAPQLAEIAVTVPPASPDADDDGDVDLADYARLMECAKVAMPPATWPCISLDLHSDGVIDVADVVEFVPLLTGPMSKSGGPPVQVAVSVSVEEEGGASGTRDALED